jgi:hypothetical protein
MALMSAAPLGRSVGGLTTERGTASAAVVAGLTRTEGPGDARTQTGSRGCRAGRHSRRSKGRSLGKGNRRGRWSHYNCNGRSTTRMNKRRGSRADRNLTVAGANNKTATKLGVHMRTWNNVLLGRSLAHNEGSNILATGLLGGHNRARNLSVMGSLGDRRSRTVAAALLRPPGVGDSHDLPDPRARPGPDLAGSHGTGARLGPLASRAAHHEGEADRSRFPDCWPPWC